MGMSLKQVDDMKLFNTEALQAEGYKLVFFWEPWCGPCRAMIPVMEEMSWEIKNGKLPALKALEKNMRDKVEIIAFNTNNLSKEERNIVANKYGSNAIPAFSLFINGKKINHTIVGGMSRSPIDRWLEEGFRLPVPARTKSLVDDRPRNESITSIPARPTGTTAADAPSRLRKLLAMLGC